MLDKLDQGIKDFASLEHQQYQNRVEEGLRIYLYLDASSHPGLADRAVVAHNASIR